MIPFINNFYAKENVNEAIVMESRSVVAWRLGAGQRLITDRRDYLKEAFWGDG